MAGRKSIRPKLFQNNASTKSTMQKFGNALVQKTLNAGMEAINSSRPNDIEVIRKPKYLEVTEARLNKLGVIDLKPYFAHSSKKKMKKDGGWYLKIPISRKKKGMSRRMYDQLRQVNISPNNQRTVVSDYLYDRRRNSDATMLNYKPKSKNITKQRIGKNRHSYTAYRTVSDKSPASSWIINRSRVNTDDTSKTFIKNVDRLIKWKMKNGWK
ncbi:hypothetical protein 015DV002_175 [Bacillus phage 015DV002]|nr:hypothetical protein 000TH008_184 [Bacillus phage 000TH008]QQO40878.1 hypothetical protein 000TH009_184 [Bacillus phage 000TH009]QQO41129.1 hypothetical protein 015DV002_175 [Bacillus phage 015DV002]QQO41406.1 hypothetical protein 015DV004_191 [Bacillus phage 015DV004]